MRKNIYSHNSIYKPEIDGLRAFAVVAVIINHFNKNFLSSGYLGVDIFFVISGYVMTSSFSLKTSANLKDLIIGFYIRRIKRLVPALSVFVLITSLAICLFSHSPKLELLTGISSLFGFSNLYLLHISTDYFAPSTELNVFTHTWSLGVEEQFYILFPFLIWFSGFSKQTRNSNKNLFILLGVLTIASLILFIYLYANNKDAAYFLMPSRFWEIATGSLLFLGLQKKISILNLFERIPPFLILILIISVMNFPFSYGAFSIVLIVLFTSILITSLNQKKALYKVFTNSKVVYIGLISYSLYLWHWGVLSISRWTIGIHWWTIPIQIALIFGLAVASHNLIEIPFRNSDSSSMRFTSLVAYLGIFYSFSGLILFLGKSFEGSLFLGSEYSKWNLHVFRDKKVIRDKKARTIYLLGDSYAGHYGAVMHYLADKNGFNLIMHPQGNGLKLKRNNNAEYILAPLRNYKEDFNKGDIIVFSASIAKYGYENDWTSLYETFIDQTQNIEMTFILLSPIPTFPSLKRGDVCSKEWFRPSWSISDDCFGRINKNDWLSSKFVSFKSIRKFQYENPMVEYIDSLFVICPKSYCFNYDQTALLYKDGSHLSSYGSMKFINTIEKLF